MHRRRPSGTTTRLASNADDGFEGLPVVAASGGTSGGRVAGCARGRDLVRDEGHRGWLDLAGVAHDGVRGRALGSGQGAADSPSPGPRTKACRLRLWSANSGLEVDQHGRDAQLGRDVQGGVLDRGCARRHGYGRRRVCGLPARGLHRRLVDRGRPPVAPVVERRIHLGQRLHGGELRRELGAPHQRLPVGGDVEHDQAVRDVQRPERGLHEVPHPPAGGHRLAGERRRPAARPGALAGMKSVARRRDATGLDRWRRDSRRPILPGRP